jgi:alpha-galactosidase
MPRRSTLFAAASLLGALVLPVAAHAAPTTVVSSGDASISRDQSAGTWTLSAGGTTLVLTLDAGRDFSLTRLATASGVPWVSASVADSLVQVGAQTLTLGSRAAGFSLVDVTTEEHGPRLQLNATFELANPRLRVTRHYRIAAESPTFEVWNTYAAVGGPTTLSDLNALRVIVPNGPIRSLTGLRGDNADVQTDGVFTLRRRTLGTSGRLSIGAKGRSSETAVPWIAVEGTSDEFYAAVMWSGAWALTADRSGSTMMITAGLGSMSTVVRERVDGPHVLFGVVPGGLAAATAAIRSYIIKGVREGRPLSPLVTYNTWFAYGTTIDESSMLSEMASAALLGAELFVVDAGWYAGAGADGPSDFDAGLGLWTPDPGRFPGGLRPLRDRAHELGMKFGVWVEPERINLAMLEAAGVPEEWLVTADGEYGSDHAAQICLATSAARQWVLDKLTALLDEVQPDYLKWDNNMWVNCDREGHTHGPNDGNFAEVNGLYDVLTTLREQYPDLIVENVSGGGNRLDIGMLRFSDVAWMDDRTAPSVHVRHNLEGLSAVFPPAYLLSFVTDHETEPLHDGSDLPLYMRSRMGGILGLCFRTADFSEGDAATLSHEIDIYKGLRATLSVASGSLLTPQAAVGDPAPSWDAFQVAAPDSQSAIIGAYQTDDGVDRINVKPVGLDPETTYEVTSVDSGVLGKATGAALMADGIDVLQSPNTAAHILLLRAAEGDITATRKR